MNKNFTNLITFLLIFIATNVFGTNVSSGVIQYRNIGNLKFEITFKIYRDCRGSALDTINSELKSNSYSRKLSPTRISIKDVSTNCKKAGNPCSSPNTSNAGFGIEEHIYKDTVDFNNTQDSVLKKYCWVIITAKLNYRSEYITTGGKNTTFFINSKFNICDAPNNSSPSMFIVPVNYLCVNQPVYLADNAFDEDNDSLSYMATPILTDDTTKIKWNNGFYFNSPFKTYYPSGYDKSKGPKPYANPPIGFYLDPETGEIIFTPINYNETSPICIKISEWRKDKDGKYNLIGEINREVIYNFITCNNNNIPTLEGSYYYQVCENDQICFNINSNDKTFIPPPPSKPIYDTTTLTWNNPIKGSTITIVDTTARLKSAKFCWTPPPGSARDLPYSFVITAKDNACDFPGVVSKNFKIKVTKNAKASFSIKYLKNGVYAVNAEPEQNFKGQPNYFWEIFDSSNKISSGYYFGSSNTFYSTKQIDTIFFSNGGKYFLHFRINNLPYNCPVNYFDTLFVPTSKPFMYILPTHPFDTTVCRNTIDTIFPIIKNAVYPVKFRWNTSPADTLPYLIINNNKEQTYKLDVYDADSSHRSAIWQYHLFSDNIEVKTINDVLSCVNDTVNLISNVKNYVDTVIWRWYFDGNAISDKQNINVTQPGKYIIAVNDKNNCKITYDTVEIKNMKVTVFAGNDLYKCTGDTIEFAASGLDTSNQKKGKYYWYYDNLSNTPISTLKNVRFNDIKDGKMIVKLEQTQGSLTCFATDTVNFYYRNIPEVMLKDTFVCQNRNIINLMSLIKKPKYTEKGIINWSISTKLKKPDGSILKTYDIIYDSDTSEKNKYFLDFSKSKIDLNQNFNDFLTLKFSYIDTFGCKSNMSDSVKFTINSTLDIEFLNSEIKICHGDSISNLSDRAGVNYYGGNWFTNNDSAGYEKWDVGNKFKLSENIKTGTLKKSGGKYLIKYEIENNNCTSQKDIELNILPIPKISFNQTTKDDSVVYEDVSTYSTNRLWFVEKKLVSKNKTLTLSKNDALKKLIMIKAFNELCEADSFIKTKVTWNIADLKGQQDFKILPNPVENILNIISEKNKPFSFTIYNEFSQKIIQNDLLNSSAIIDLSECSSGIYLILIKCENRIFTLKFMKK